jgi:hypothetical protein
MRIQRAGLLAIVAVVAIATPACSSVATHATVSRSMKRSRVPAVGGTCTAEPPGCGSARSTAQRLADFTWSGAPAPPLSPRIAQGSVWTGTELLIWGGSQQDRGLASADDGAAYDPTTRSWTRMPASPLSRRNGSFAVWTGTTALFWGGGGSTGLLDMNGASFDPSTRTWAVLPAAPLPTDAQRRQAIVWTGRQMVVIQPAASAAYTPATNSWTAMPTLPEVAGCEPFAITAAWTGSDVITWLAGRPPTVNGVTPSGFCYHAYSWTTGDRMWTDVPGQSGYPSFPSGTAAHIDGRLLFLGGLNCPPGVSCPLRHFFDGTWLDTSSGTWTGLPQSYSGGSGPAVWTGSAMVVFQTTAGATPGSSIAPPGVAPGAGAAFDPSRGTWTDLARCPIPYLTNASVTWTGRQLIVVTLDNESGDHPQVEVLSPPVRDGSSQH